MSLLKFSLKTLNKDEFARAMIDAGREHGWGENLRYLREDFAITGDKGFRANLANVYLEYCGTSIWKRTQVLKNFIGAFGSISGSMDVSFAKVKNNLLPRIREKMY